MIICPACGESRDDTKGIIAWCAACSHRWLVATPTAGCPTEADGQYPHDSRFEAYATGFVREVLRARRAPPGRLLDGGCGTGDFLRIAGQLGYDAEGVDLSSEAVAACRERGLKATAGDLLNADLTGPFDVITLWDVVEHLHNPHAALARLAQLLADSGILFAKVPIYGTLSPRLSNRVPRAAGALLGAPGHAQYFTPRSLDRLVHRAGLRAEWLPRRDLRSRRSGGSLKRRLGRFGARVIKRASRDGNMLLIACRP